MPLPKDSTPKANRWEGTHLYSRSAGRKRPRTVADLREEAAARRESDREKRISEARGTSPGASAGTGASAGASAKNSGPSTAPGPDQDQEEPQDSEMPGSGKKKRNASGRPNDAGQEEPHEPNPNGAGIDPALKNFLLSIKTDINATTNEAISRIDRRIEKTEENIQELRTRMDVQDKRIDSKIAQEVAKLNTLPSAAKASKAVAAGRREEAYFLSRRSLKLWPIEGEDLADAARVFFANKLGMTDDRIRALGELRVSPAPGKAPRDRKEVLVTFDNSDDRDAVKALGSSLAGQRAAGMSVHVPGHLLDSLYALNGVGYSIKNKNEGVRRSIKFDDLEQDIYLDIFVGGQWKKITPSEARGALKKLPSSSASSLSNTLSSDDISSLIQGEVVPGLTAVVIPEEST